MIWIPMAGFRDRAEESFPHLNRKCCTIGAEPCSIELFLGLGEGMGPRRPSRQ